MPSANIHMGIPLGGIRRDGPRRLITPESIHQWTADDIDGLRIQDGRYLRPWPAIGDYATLAINAERITRIVNTTWNDGTFEVFRHSMTGFHRLSSGAWADQNTGGSIQDIDTDTEDYYWSSAIVPGNTGQRGYYLFTTDLKNVATTDQIFLWDGATAAPSTAFTGTVYPSRHVAKFADRAWLFNQIVSGARQGNRAQWSKAGDGSDWSAVGSGAAILNDIVGPINGAYVAGGILFVFGKRHILRGVESFDVDAPVYFDPFVSDGIGIWAPNSVVVHEDGIYFLSEKGFRRLVSTGNNNQQIQDIGPQINKDILRNIERGAIETVSAALIPSPWNIVVWALPMGGSGFPTELWAYEIDTQRWTRVSGLFSSSAAVTAMGLVSTTSGVTWGSLVGTWGAQIGSWGSLGGTATQPLLVTGHEDGETHVVSDGTLHETLEVTLDIPSYSYEGALLLGASRGKSQSATRIRPRDVITLDGLTLGYESLDSTTGSTLYILATNSGSWEHIGTLTLPAAAVGTFHEVESGFRYSGPAPRVRITNRHPTTGALSPLRAMLEDINVNIRRSGAVRFAQ